MVPQTLLSNYLRRKQWCQREALILNSPKRQEMGSNLTEKVIVSHALTCFTIMTPEAHLFVL